MATDAAASQPTLTSDCENDAYDKRCIFCRIAKKETDTELLHSDEETSCFRDIRPGAPHHYLVVPSRHVGNCKSLGKEHVPLVEKLLEVGKAVLEKNGFTDLGDVRFGFHWPPFCSVTHLHLHVLAPASQLGFLSRVVYRLDSYWFITADQLLSRLSSLG
ncbi:adenosine 5'-monophosphoramidase HINT3 [Denticeps clupeoides]|uniref:Adenosine 5'-monophosphoramidase HINT3 n=1 Tax=Denticeps clupeoides TaxID=299321 RepID=A0AAY4E844_9TELE|nr:histidine triad nucleotide-binding protein 3 [Denticeps clupeoides]